jgi:hypothetical protein
LVARIFLRRSAHCIEEDDMTVTQWSYQRDKTIKVLQDTPDGTEFTVSIGDKCMVFARQGYALHAAKRILGFLEGAMVSLAEGKPHYQPVVDKVRLAIKAIDECAEEVDRADVVNKLKDGVAEGTG